MLAAWPPVATGQIGLAQTEGGEIEEEEDEEEGEEEEEERSKPALLSYRGKKQKTDEVEEREGGGE